MKTQEKLKIKEENKKLKKENKHLKQKVKRYIKLMLSYQ